MPTLFLVQILPKAGFAYTALGGTVITQRPDYDMEIQRAVRADGVRWARPDVTSLLVVVFETLTVTLQAVYVPRSDDIAAITAVYEAIDVTHRATGWAATTLEPAVFHQLVLGVRAARRVSLRQRGRDEAEPGSWAGRLARAVDGFDVALGKRGWSGAKELRVLEGSMDGEGDEEMIREARSIRAGGHEEGISDQLEGMRFGGRRQAMEEDDDDDDLEIVTGGSGGVATGGDVDMMDAGGTTEGSIEPYLGADGF